MTVAVRRDRSQLALAALPLFFGIQQFSEGLAWLGLTHERPALVQSAALVFLFFALTFWPFWLPFSALCQSGRTGSRWLPGVILPLSVVWFVTLYLPLLTAPDRWLNVRIVHHSIQYDYRDLWLIQVVPPLILRGIYFFSIGAPLYLVFQNRDMQVWGVLFAVSPLVAQWFFSYTFTSVWCLFAAYISAGLVFAFRNLPARVDSVEMHQRPETDMPVGVSVTDW
jgi:hypothetical protein